MKTTLTVNIDYNPKKTDPEGLATAMDRLLETVLSTPGIMEEYGTPRIGKFFVAGATGQSYTLRIDGAKLREQRRLLERILDRDEFPHDGDDSEVLEGLLDLIAEIADQGHDCHSIDCLEPEEGPDNDRLRS